MFIKKKCCGRIKARGCADGWKQREHTCAIDAKEERDVAVAGISGAFMQVDQVELLHVKVAGKMAEIMVQIDPALYTKYVILEHGKKVLYIELKKALYGTLRAALLFWQRLTEQLKEWGFKISPYDWCVTNKTINDKQCTIV